MAYSNYLGHESQVSGVEEHRLVGGKGRKIPALTYVLTILFVVMYILSAL